MAETEVESILREIRERVVAQQRVAQTSASVVAGNGARGGEIQSSPRDQAFADNLALINSYLTTTNRAWDRLPPLVSNRRGVSARIELWLKRQLKRATRWFTWEQVNFNAAVNQALRDIVSVLAVMSAYEEELKQLRSQLSAVETHCKELEQAQTALKEEISTGRLHHESEMADQRRATEILRSINEQRVATLEVELRERLTLLQEEQRVCFKQLSLETSEAAVLEDRARRKTEALLEELQRRLEK
jgi:hypothetical protein